MEAMRRAATVGRRSTRRPGTTGWRKARPPSTRERTWARTW